MVAAPLTHPTKEQKQNEGNIVDKQEPPNRENDRQQSDSSPSHSSNSTEEEDDEDDDRRDDMYGAPPPSHLSLSFSVLNSFNLDVDRAALDFELGERNLFMESFTSKYCSPATRYMYDV